MFADDWGRYASIIAEIEKHPSLNQVIKTPNIDRVAREGAFFTRAFVNSPSCTPCRSALMSGRYFFNCDRAAILNGAIWDSNIPSFPLTLQAESNYRLGKSYKVWSPGDPADAPIGGQKYGYEKAGRDPNNFSESVTKLVAEGKAVEAARESILDQVRGNFDAFMADDKPGQPWLYFFGPTTTHRTWIKGSGKKLWGIEPDALKGKLPPFLPDVPEVREDIADYLGEAQAYDAYVGVLLAKLEATGQAERTVVIVSGDHGMPGVPRGKCNLYDHGTAVSLAIRCPGTKPGRVIDDFVNMMDMAPTIMELGGATIPAGVNGRSLVPLLISDQSGQIDPTRDWVITGRERHVAGAREGNLPYPHRALRTADYLYIRNFEPTRWPLGSPGGVSLTGPETPPTAELEDSTYAAFSDMDASPTKAWLIEHRSESQWQPLFDLAFGKRPAEELYDLKKDPNEMVNLAADPAYAKQRAKLATQLLGELKQVGDPRVTTNPVKFELPPFTDAGQKGKGKGKGKAKE